MWEVFPIFLGFRGVGVGLRERGGGEVVFCFFFPYTFLKKGERVGEMRLLAGGMGGEGKGVVNFGGGDVLLWAGGNMVPGISVDGWMCC